MSRICDHSGNTRPLKLVPVFGCLSTSTRPVHLAQQNSNHAARLDVDAAEHVTGAPEVVGNTLATRNFPGRPKQRRSFIIDQHKHPHGAKLVADHLGNFWVWFEPSLEQVAALRKLLGLFHEFHNSNTLPLIRNEAIARAIVTFDICDTQTTPAICRFRKYRIPSLVAEKTLNVVLIAHRLSPGKRSDRRAAWPVFRGSADRARVASAVSVGLSSAISGQGMSKAYNSWASRSAPRKVFLAAGGNRSSSNSRYKKYSLGWSLPSPQDRLAISRTKPVRLFPEALASRSHSTYFSPASSFLVSSAKPVLYHLLPRTM